MADWSDRADRLLFDGETVESEHSVGTATVVVVTSHRVLSFTPHVPGRDYRPVDRPNVRGLERRSISEHDLVGRALKLGLVGGLLLAVGLAVDPEALLPRPDVSDVPATGNVLGLVDTVIGLFHAMDEVLLLAGGLLLVVAVGLAGWEVRTRRDRLAIVVAGEADVLLPDALGDAELSALEAAMTEPPEEPVGTDGAATTGHDREAGDEHDGEATDDQGGEPTPRERPDGAE